jgi:hypothetical protein
MKKLSLFLALFATTSLLIISCKKDANTDLIAASTEDLAVSHDDLEQIDADADQIIDERGGSGNCPTLTWANAVGTFPNTLTIDFGTACTRPDGRVVSGSIIVDQSAEMSVTGAVRVISFSDFFVDDVKIEGVRTRTNNGLNTSGQPSHTVVADQIKRIFTDGTSIVHSGSHTFTMVQGYATPDIRLDNAFEITGSGTLTGRQGNEFTCTITEPLLKKYTCRWIVSGKLENTRNGETRTIDFGTGDCDRKAELTTPNGNTRIITLRR